MIELKTILSNDGQALEESNVIIQWIEDDIAAGEGQLNETMLFTAPDRLELME